METLIDELATRAKMDPIAYRRKLLKPEAKKLRAVLDLLDEKSAGWRKNSAERTCGGHFLSRMFWDRRCLRG
jgi:isoquinoline 1-oxidoreductase beta subunit